MFHIAPIAGILTLSLSQHFLAGEQRKNTQPRVILQQNETLGLIRNSYKGKYDFIPDG